MQKLTVDDVAQLAKTGLAFVWGDGDTFEEEEVAQDKSDNQLDIDQVLDRMDGGYL
jgi:hypothetical protein